MGEVDEVGGTTGRLLQFVKIYYAMHYENTIICINNNSELEEDLHLTYFVSSSHQIYGLWTL